jgi:hypothetical protein
MKNHINRNTGCYMTTCGKSCMHNQFDQYLLKERFGKPIGIKFSMNESDYIRNRFKDLLDLLVKKGVLTDNDIQSLMELSKRDG